MALFLPFTSFILASILIKRKIGSFSSREALVLVFLLLGAVILLSTEILSAFKLFSFWPLCFLWALITAVLFYLNRRQGISIKINPITPFSLQESFLVKLILILIAVLGVIAITTPPNTWDAMTYHMSRVAHWVQNSTVAFYPTKIQRQLYINPFAEYWIAQLVILSGGSDQWANMPQWISMIGTLLVISLIAQVIGIGRWGQILSAFFVITLPNAIVQATSTQTDFVVTLWVSIAVYFILRNIKLMSWSNTFAISMAVILAAYTKGTGLFILLPFWAWGVCAHSKGRLWRGSLLILCCMMGAAGFLLLRNYLALGACVFYGDQNHMLALNDFKGMISSLALHSCMHLRTGIIGIDQGLSDLLDAVHQALGMNVMQSSANFNVLPFNYMKFPFAEDEMPNFIFYAGFLAAGTIYCFSKDRDRGSLKAKYFLMAFSCFFLFNTLVKWTPFDGRYHLPFFVLLAPLLADIFLRYRHIIVYILILFSFSAGVFIITNQSKPLEGRSSLWRIPREYKYFYNRPPSLISTKAISDAIVRSGCHEIGFDIGEDTWEYPFWAYLKNKVSPLRIEHVLVNNSSKALSYPLGPFMPCQIVSGQNAASIDYEGKKYLNVGGSVDLSLYNLVKTAG